MNSETFQGICHIANTNGMNFPKIDGECRRMVYAGEMEIKFVEERTVELGHFLAEINGNLPKFKAWVLSTFADLYIEDWKIRNEGARCLTPQRKDILSNRNRETFMEDLVITVNVDYHARQFTANIQFKPHLDEYFFQDIDSRDLLG